MENNECTKGGLIANTLIVICGCTLHWNEGHLIELIYKRSAAAEPSWSSLLFMFSVYCMLVNYRPRLILKCLNAAQRVFLFIIEVLCLLCISDLVWAHAWLRSVEQMDKLLKTLGEKLSMKSLSDNSESIASGLIAEIALIYMVTSNILAYRKSCQLKKRQLSCKNTSSKFTQTMNFNARPGCPPESFYSNFLI